MEKICFLYLVLEGRGLSKVSNGMMAVSFPYFAYLHLKVVY